jgi:hypothetical protein
MFDKRYTLLRSQKKRVYEILREAGLEPGEFSWSQEKIAQSLIVSKLNHRDGEHYFQFSSYEMNAWCVACPGQFRSMDYHYPKSWDEQEKLFAQWARTLKVELDNPDPWVEMAKYGLTFNGDGGLTTANEPIPALEAEQIGWAMTRLVDRLTRGLSLDAEQSRLVQERCEHIAEMARRQRSRDWAYTVLGVCTSMAMMLSPSQEQLPVLWEILESELSEFIRLQPPHRTRGRGAGRIFNIRSRTVSDEAPHPAEHENAEG